MSASMEARIAAYIHDHYYPCWASGLSLGGQTYTPIVEFHLSRDGELEGRPKLLNASASPTEHARGEQAMQAVRRCSPMRIPPEFMPYYEEALREVTNPLPGFELVSWFVRGERLHPRPFSTLPRSRGRGSKHCASSASRKRRS